MADAYDPLHAQLNAPLRRTAPRTLLPQYPGASNSQGEVWTAEQYYDTSLVDYVMNATGGEGTWNGSVSTPSTGRCACIITCRRSRSSMAQRGTKVSLAARPK